MVVLRTWEILALSLIAPVLTLIYTLFVLQRLHGRLDAVADAGQAKMPAAAVPVAVVQNPRALDWTCAFLLFVLGLTLVLPGDSLGPAIYYSEFLKRAPEEVWGWICVVVGAARIASLIINGYWHASPLLRAAAAGIGVVMWLQFSFAFFIAGWSAGVVVAGAPFNLVLACADLYSCWRAGRDAVHSRRAHEHVYGH